MAITQNKQTIIEHYENLSSNPEVYEYYGKSYFLNYGYWEDHISDQKSACENLMAKLLAFIPVKSGSILDVACGNGATTAYLKKYYPAENITAINISEKQIEIAKKVAQGCNFFMMDATRLNFPDNSFDHIISVEAAFHFNTREQFFMEAYRVLKPGGMLVLSDVLVTLPPEHSREIHAEKSYVEDLETYETRLKDAGFKEITIIDATKACWKSHFMHIVNYVHEKYLERKINLEDVSRYLEKAYRRVSDLEFYLLGAARKI